MKGITSYHIVSPGDLWVRSDTGTLRRATATEEITLLNHAPDIALQFGWQSKEASQKTIHESFAQ